jgi:hypothetical protein
MFLLMDARNPLLCDLCAFVGATESHLRGHRFREHNASEGVLFCSVCNRACMSQRGLELHVSHYCKGKEEDFVIVPPTYLKCCPKCTSNLTKQTEWNCTKEKTHRYRTYFLCNSCFEINQLN